MANTGLTQGPFTPVLDTPIDVNDPANPPASVAVQVQNASVYNLTVVSLGDSFTIPAFTATTIPTGNGTGVTITPTLEAVSSATGTIYCVFLLPGQSSPIDDGPLTAQAVAAIVTGALAVTTTQFLAVSAQEVTHGALFSSPLTGFTYPSGLGPTNFHAAFVSIYTGDLSVGDDVSVWLTDENGHELWAQTFTNAGASLGDEYWTAAIPLEFGTVSGADIVVKNNSATAFITVDIILDQEPTAPAVVIAGVPDGVVVPTQPGGTIVQPNASVTRPGSSGAGSTNLGPAAGFIYVTCVVLVWEFTTITITGTLEVSVQDADGQILCSQLFGTGEVGNGSVVVPYPDDGVPATPQCVLNFSDPGTITTLTGEVRAIMSYRS